MTYGKVPVYMTQPQVHYVPVAGATGGSGFQPVVQNLAGAAIVGGANHLYNKFKKASSRSFVNDSGSKPLGLSTQRDGFIQYRKKRLSKKGVKKYKAQKKFKGRVRAVINTDLPKNTIVYSGAHQGGSLHDTQGYISLGLFGTKSTGDGADVNGYNDINNIVNHTGTAPVPTATYRFSMGRIDITMRNSGVSGEQSIEMDIYHIKPKRKCIDGYQYVDDALNASLLAMDKYEGAEGSATRLAMSQPGVTPFQCPEFCRKFTILKKWKRFVPLGDTVTFSKTIKQNKYIRAKEVNEETNTWQKNTFMDIFLIVHRGMPYKDSESISRKCGSTVLDMSVTRQYEFTTLEGTPRNDASAYNPDANNS